MAVKKQNVRAGWPEAWGILLLALCALMFLSMVSYNPYDISLLKDPPNDPALNFIGPAGAWFAFFAFSAFGVAGYLLPVCIGGMGVIFLLKTEGRLWPKAAWMTVMLLAITLLLEMQTQIWNGLLHSLNVGSPGGHVGHLLGTRGLVRIMGGVGTGILSFSGLVIGAIFLFEIHPFVLARRLWEAGLALYKQWEEARAEKKDRSAQIEDEAKEIAKRRQRLEEAMKQREKSIAAETARKPPPREDEPEAIEPPVRPAETSRVTAPPPPAKTERPKPSPKPKAEEEAPMAPVTMSSSYRLPGLDLLDTLPPTKDREIRDDHQAAGTILKETLAEFGIEAEVVNVERGPVVTRYEVLPAPGVRVERIAGLSNNIALVMKAESVRVQAPIPGKGLVGIEVPNTLSSMVFLRELIESDTWRHSRAALPLALGKDVGGHVLIADLADMPHALIAGATGSGKTVCMNSILAGLLMSRTPEQMRLMLIDPKIVEFSAYEKLPHLVVPVITDAKKVSLGLRWAINEMEKRYKLLAKAGVRNIKSYNSRPIVKQAELFEGVEEGEEEKEERPPDRLPYIVIVIDELADLMLAAQAEIEGSIARLAQLSRAVGIHMIIATQRPSVNVITGTIKANFPARIAFQVAQKVDSRTILDAGGADKLLGRGDMLFLPPGSAKLIRAQGTMTSDEDIRRIVAFIRDQAEPQYEVAIKEKIESKAALIPDMEEDDDMLEAAIEIIRQTRRASTSSLQRRLRIGYTRAARLMDLLEERGVVGPPQGSDPREILIDLDGEIPQNVAEEEN